MRAARQGYSRLQIILHWTIALLIAWQIVVHEPMERAWRAFVRGETAPPDEAALVNLHIIAGLAILLLALGRLGVRFGRGVPAAPPQEPAILRGVASLTHGLLYVVMIAMPLTGLAAWFGGIRQAAQLHSLGETALLVLVGLHVLGALYHQFVLDSGVMMRMFRAER